MRSQPDSGLFNANACSFPLVCISLLGVHNSPIPVSILHNSPSSQKKLKYNKGHIYNENKPPHPVLNPQEAISAIPGHCQ